ncbi:DedA family protein [Motilimonas eburnea]|uniref:DedA family protein n=1 Tax=Motilimonas eburnea TaxID=1737488 RepID=UPI001E652979|nr:DedA family protein [Motilimonas eburnea]MCE2571095.1 DedA family protein [Motilimonas eburnea]
MEQVWALLNQYGVWVYGLLFVYCALKSGSLPLFAGYAAHHGALSLAGVALVTFLGGYLGDELRFVLARRYGDSWLNKPNWFGRLFRHGRELAQRYGSYYIFIYRYPKGLRTVGSLPIGLTDMPWARFTWLNGASALLWVTLLVGGGYSFGATFDALGVTHFTAFTVLLLVLFLLGMLRLWWRQSRLGL